MLDGHLHIVIIIHIPSAFYHAFNDKQTLFLLRSAYQTPNQLLFTSCNCHKRRSVDAVDAFLNHKDTLAAL